MAAMERPAPAERMAVFEMREFPGRESSSDCALVLGSSLGTLEAARADVRLVSAGTLRKGIAGRTRVAPDTDQFGFN